ncbi:MAG: hypothetical protein ABSD77_08020 [Verrucomicrobiota bacterium]|jgi:hypothetical protein
MEAKHIIEHIRTQLNKASASGIQYIEVSALLAFLSELERAAPAATEDVKFQHESQLAFHRSQHEASLEMFRSVIDAGRTALKTCILINGGAAIALLAFIGNLYSKGNVSIAPGLTSALIHFSIGVFLAGLTSGFTYLAQGCFHRNRIKMGEIFNWIGISFVVFAYFLFLVGIFEAHCSFLTQPK